MRHSLFLFRGILTRFGLVCTGSLCKIGVSIAVPCVQKLAVPLLQPRFFLFRSSLVSALLLVPLECSCQIVACRSLRSWPSWPTWRRTSNEQRWRWNERNGWCSTSGKKVWTQLVFCFSCHYHLVSRPPPVSTAWALDARKTTVKIQGKKHRSIDCTALIYDHGLCGNQSDT